MAHIWLVLGTGKNVENSLCLDGENSSVLFFCSFVVTGWQKPENSNRFASIYPAHCTFLEKEYEAEIQSLVSKIIQTRVKSGSATYYLSDLRKVFLMFCNLYFLIEEWEVKLFDSHKTVMWFMDKYQQNHLKDENSLYGKENRKLWILLEVRDEAGVSQLEILTFQVASSWWYCKNCQKFRSHREKIFQSMTYTLTIIMKVSMSFTWLFCLDCVCLSASCRSWV